MSESHCRDDGSPLIAAYSGCMDFIVSFLQGCLK